MSKEKIFFSLTININNLNKKNNEKIITFAAAAVAFGASAQTLTQTWKVETANNLPFAECRQGVGLNGKIYVNNKADKKVYVVDKDGVSATTLPGGANCGIGHDQAGNLLVSNAVFPNKWADDAVIKVYKPQTPETVTEITITADLAGMGRSDFLGSAMGDLSTDGQMYLLGGASTGLGKLVVIDGATSGDDSYIATVDDKANPTSSSGITQFFMDGEIGKYLLMNRSGSPCIIKEEGDNLVTEKAMTLQDRGTCNGGDVVILGGKRYVVYPTTPNYTDGFAIADIDAEPMVTEDNKSYIPFVVEHKAELAANPNNFQGNFVNAEKVSETEAIIYQYVPGAYTAAYSFKLPAEQTGINDVNAANDVKVRKVYENGQVYIIKGDVKYNVMGAQVK